MTWLSVDFLYINISDEKPIRSENLDVWVVNGGHDVSIPIDYKNILINTDLTWDDEPIELTEEYLALLKNKTKIHVKCDKNYCFDVNIYCKVFNNSDLPYYANYVPHHNDYNNGTYIEFDYQQISNEREIFNYKEIEVVYSIKSGKVKLINIPYDIKLTEERLEILFNKIKQKYNNKGRILNNLEISKNIINEILKKKYYGK